MCIFRAQAEGKQAGPRGRPPLGRRLTICPTALQLLGEGEERSQAEADARFRRGRGGFSAGQHDIAGACSGGSDGHLFNVSAARRARRSQSHPPPALCRRLRGRRRRARCAPKIGRQQGAPVTASRRSAWPCAVRARAAEAESESRSPIRRVRVELAELAALPLERAPATTPAATRRTFRSGFNLRFSSN